MTTLTPELSPAIIRDCEGMLMLQKQFPKGGALYCLYRFKDTEENLELLKKIHKKL